MFFGGVDILSGDELSGTVALMLDGILHTDVHHKIINNY